MVPVKLYPVLLASATLGCAFAQPGFDFNHITIANAAGGPGISPGSLVALGQGIISDHSRLRIEFGTGDLGFTAPVLDNPAYPPGLWTVVPEGLPVGPASVVLITDGVRGPMAIFDVVARAPGLFAANYTSFGPGFGPALAQNYTRSAVAPVAFTNPVVLGQDVTLWATGLGDTTTADVTIEVAGEPVPATFAAHHEIAGLDQVNFRVPPDAFTGCYVPVAIRTGEVRSNLLTLAVNPTPGACAHPLGLSYGDLRALDAGQSLPVGEVAIQSKAHPAIASEAEAALAQFEFREPARIFQLAGFQMPDQQYFACPIQDRTPLIGYSPHRIDVGQVTLFGPEGRRLAIRGDTETARGEHPFFIAGPWQVSAAGGADAPAFQEPFALPPPVHWTDADAYATLDRADGSTVTWDPQGYTPADIATITLAIGGSSIACRAHAADGRFHIPANLIEAVLAGAGGHAPRPAILTIAITPHPLARTRFFFPLAGATAAPAIIHYTLEDRVTVQIPEVF